MRAGDEPSGAILAGRARTGHEEPDAVVAADLVRGHGGVVDMADDIVPVEGLCAGPGPNFEDGGIVQLGVAGTLLLFVTELEVRESSRSATFLGSWLSSLITNDEREYGLPNVETDESIDLPTSAVCW